MYRLYQTNNLWSCDYASFHYGDVVMGAIASQITSLTIVYSTVYSGADQRKHQSSESMAFVRGIHRGPVNSPHKWPVTRKMFPFDDVIMFIFGTHHVMHTIGLWWIIFLRWITSKHSNHGCKCNRMLTDKILQLKCVILAGHIHHLWSKY